MGLLAYSMADVAVVVVVGEKDLKRCHIKYDVNRVARNGNKKEMRVRTRQSMGGRGEDKM